MGLLNSHPWAPSWSLQNLTFHDPPRATTTRVIIVFSHNFKLWVYLTPIPDRRRRLCWIWPFATPPCHHDRGSCCCCCYFFNPSAPSACMILCWNGFLRSPPESSPRPNPSWSLKKKEDARHSWNYGLSTLMTVSYGLHGEGLTKTTIITTTTPVVVARGGRERSNPAKTTTALRDES